VSMQVKPGGQGRDRTGDLPLFRRTLIPTELPGPEGTVCLAMMATLTGLEPATSAVTGRRANQLRHRALLCCVPHVTTLQYPLRDSNPRYRLERAAS
jgi:integrase